MVHRVILLSRLALTAVWGQMELVMNFRLRLNIFSILIKILVYNIFGALALCSISMQKMLLTIKNVLILSDSGHKSGIHVLIILLALL